MTLVQPWGMVYTGVAVQAKNPSLTPGQDSKACRHLFPPSRKNKSYNCEVGWKMLKTGNNGGPTITRSLSLVRRKSGFLLYNKLPYRLLAAQPKHCLLSDYHNRKWHLTLKGSERPAISPFKFLGLNTSSFGLAGKSKVINQTYCV